MHDVVVISPHLDDAVLSAWHVLVRGAGVEVVTCFAGPDGSPEPSYAVRRQEDLEVLGALGCTARHLDHDDSAFRSAPAPLLVDRLTGELDGVLTSCRELWLPLGIGRHPDHLLARSAGLTAGRRRRVAIHLYADLPYAARSGWPARPPLRWTRELAAVRVPPWRLRRRSVELDDGARTSKLAAARGYRSQADHLGYGSSGAPSLPQLLEREVWWELT